MNCPTPQNSVQTILGFIGGLLAVCSLAVLVGIAVLGTVWLACGIVMAPIIIASGIVQSHLAESTGEKPMIGRGFFPAIFYTLACVAIFGQMEMLEEGDSTANLVITLKITLAYTIGFALSYALPHVMRRSNRLTQKLTAWLLAFAVGALILT